MDGTFDKTLKPGQVYQVIMYKSEYENPNDTTTIATSNVPPPDVKLTVVALLKDPEQSNLIVSQDQNIGGTWFRKVVKTTTPTFFVLQVSKDPSFTDGAGFERFAAPLESVLDLPNVNHDKEVDPLLPGNEFFFLMRVVDQDGNWQIVRGEFRTKQRTVTITFEKLHIVNDGADGDTTAEFRIWVMEGGAAVKGFFFGDVDNFPITDRPTLLPGELNLSELEKNKEWIPLPPFCPPFILGPKDITDETNAIGILTRGLCWRALGDNDYTSNFDFGDTFPSPSVVTNVPPREILPIRTGGRENMQNEPFHVDTHIQTVDVEFQYAVIMSFSVNYT